MCVGLTCQNEEVRGQSISDWTLNPDLAIDLVRVARAVGFDRELTQSAGGNISVKCRSSLIIKASGYRLDHCAIDNGFVRVPIPSNTSAAITTFESLREGDRPSIETSMHLAIKAPVVLHVHSISSLGLSVNVERPNLPSGIEWVGYIRPGQNLATKISETLQSSPTCQGLLLQNHGFVTWGSSPTSALRQLLDIDRELRRVSSGRQSDDIARWIDVLANGSLWPDAVTFLGPNQFGTKDSASTVKVGRDGTILNSEQLSFDQIEIAHACIAAGQYWTGDLPIHYLSTDEVNDLMNWESEIYRRERGANV